MDRDFKGIWIPKEIWLNKDLKVMEKLFLVEIDSLDCSERHCYASNDYFAKFFDLSKNRCSEIIKSLENKGLITIEYRYKENTKQIEERRIKVFDKSKGGIRNIEEGYSEKCEENNTVFNNKDNIYNSIADKWNCINELSNIVKISDKRKKAIDSIIKEYSKEDILKAIDNVANSDFLRGITTNWKCSFDWILNKNNFLKILEGNYNKATDKATKKKINFEDFIE